MRLLLLLGLISRETNSQVAVHRDVDAIVQDMSSASARAVDRNGPNRFESVLVI